MWEILIGIVASFLEKIGIGWWQRRKENEARNAQNNVNAMPDDAVSEQLQQWTKKP